MNGKAPYMFMSFLIYHPFLSILLLITFSYDVMQNKTKKTLKESLLIKSGSGSCVMLPNDTKIAKIISSVDLHILIIKLYEFFVIFS